MTPAQRAWLTKLRDGKPGISSTPTGFHCRKAGWTEWTFTHRDGRRMGQAQIEAEFGSKLGSWARASKAGWEISGDMEQITPAGLAALEAAEQEDNDD